ncbi:MAG TPA: peptidoglycan-associated lipoprotein Pal [Nitrospirota bacterium]|nr:peptidoglycan-associated lipoprotein Pal [Nitrospirota bacterium]
MSRQRMYVPVIMLASILVLWGCPKKAEVTTAPEQQKQAAPSVAPAQEAPAVEQKAEPLKEEAKPEEPKERAAAVSAGLQPIYFDFDKSFIRNDARSTMQANAEWLKANPNVKIRIEGNCDERGTKEYNQALGQRRATSAKKYLTDLGISAKRITLISYGKEKPICSEHTEECWQKNRRDDFVAATE